MKLLEQCSAWYLKAIQWIRPLKGALALALFFGFFTLSDVLTFTKRNECISEKVSDLYVLSEICINHMAAHSDSDLTDRDLSATSH